MVLGVSGAMRPRFARLRFKGVQKTSSPVPEDRATGMRRRAFRAILEMFSAGTPTLASLAPTTVHPAAEMAKTSKIISRQSGKSGIGKPSLTRA